MYDSAHETRFQWMSTFIGTGSQFLGHKTTEITEIIKDLPIQSNRLQWSSVVHKLIHETKGNSHRHRRSLNIEHFKLPSRWRTATTPSYQHSAKAGWVNKNHLAMGDPRRPWWSQFRCLTIFDSSWKLRFAQVFYALVFLLGVVGNTLVIYVVIRFSKMHTVNDDKPISKGTSHNLS